MTSSILITVDELAAALAGPVPPAVLDVRWVLGRTDGRERYAEAHIPGAVYVDLDAELSGPPSAAEGRHPLPTEAALQEAARRWGVRADRPVVVYDGGGNYAAARAWWLLRHGGLADVRILDGALPAWIAAGHATAAGEETPEPGDVEIRFGALPVLGIDDVAGFEGALIDARAPERYRGETEPIDPVAGHIPGALNLPSTGNVDERGFFHAPETLRARFEPAAAHDARIAAYCGSGVFASHAVAALAIAGHEAALYPGSWSQWSNDPSRPVATGDADDERITPGV
ncbi:sulfurtransferase [Microbacterium sediminis]|uniref:sulfurtransferase n=1 Tax=Microbacterium sediminis TaxID=904291 RepID=UPI000ABC5994|nr:sulfurtransferase [Microbacterium sediminis]